MIAKSIYLGNETFLPLTTLPGVPRTEQSWVLILSVSSLGNTDPALSSLLPLHSTRHVTCSCKFLPGSVRLKMLPARLLPPCFPAGPGTPPPLLLRSVQLFNYTAQPGQQPLHSLSVPANPAAHSYSLAVSLPGRTHLPPCAFPTHSIAAGISLVQYAPGVHGNSPHPQHTHTEAHRLSAPPRAHTARERTPPAPRT